MNTRRDDQSHDQTPLTRQQMAWRRFFNVWLTKANEEPAPADSQAEKKTA